MGQDSLCLGSFFRGSLQTLEERHSVIRLDPTGNDFSAVIDEHKTVPWGNRLRGIPNVVEGQGLVYRKEAGVKDLEWQ